MNIIHHIIRGILPSALLATLALASCEGDIQLGQQTDDSRYASASRINGLLVDKSTNKNSSVAEMYADTYNTDLALRLTKRPQRGVDVQIAVDEAYAATYNTLHDTDFELFPTSHVTIAHDGKFLLAPDDQASPAVRVTLTAFEGMEKDKTYIVPLAASSPTEGITFDEASVHAVLLVKDYRDRPTPDKGKDAVKTVLYFEINDVNPLNALEFLTQSGHYFFDDVVLFAANINWDNDRKRVIVKNNENIQFLLDHNDQFLQPLREAGMRVIVSILGNHDQTGVAQLSDMGAREFAHEIAAYCRAYNLDGVAFDDEYSNSPDLSNPWLAPHNAYAGSRLMYECAKAMPDKVVSIYNLGSLFSNKLQVIDGVEPGQYCDYAVGDYGVAAGPGIGMTKKQCGGMSIELNLGGGDSSEATARARKQAGYGYYMFFALNPALYNSQVSRMKNACRGLYDEELAEPKYKYAKNSTERMPL
ncbi:MAG: DUF1735 domain-containing protein [Mediterranea sp.]|jgi:hypothetical protein|nr:DUF1735 domain-containing protein [Mediterranea sp.]